MAEELTYEQKIVQVFRDLCQKSPVGVSAFEVTEELHRRDWLASLDTVIDIADQMKSLRARGLL